MRNNTWISISTFPQCQLFQCYLESQTIIQGRKPKHMYATPVCMHTCLGGDQAEKHSDFIQWPKQLNLYCHGLLSGGNSRSTFATKDGIHQSALEEEFRFVFSFLS